ncbi:hypothetical protein FB45DRAFT_862818 [Roridomyces roridus]|uniref:Uncharacterized protein n=1 Tax=Roridomyces roridus TaxID=1738132 RepID=A0AAD7C7Z8_9AGAR|nr:hypothetical protein FB45DRAFT_862818 [Roridomyces roridus]
MAPKPRAWRKGASPSRPKAGTLSRGSEPNFAPPQQRQCHIAHSQYTPSIANRVPRPQSFEPQSLRVSLAFAHPLSLVLQTQTELAVVDASAQRRRQVRLGTPRPTAEGKAGRECKTPTRTQKREGITQSDGAASGDEAAMAMAQKLAPWQFGSKVVVASPRFPSFSSNQSPVATQGGREPLPSFYPLPLQPASSDPTNSAMSPRLTRYFLFACGTQRMEDAGLRWSGCDWNAIRSQLARNPDLSSARNTQCVGRYIAELGYEDPEEDLKGRHRTRLDQRPQLVTQTVAADGEKKRDSPTRR